MVAVVVFMIGWFGCCIVTARMFSSIFRNYPSVRPGRQYGHLKILD